MDALVHPKDHIKKVLCQYLEFFLIYVSFGVNAQVVRRMRRTSVGLCDLRAQPAIDKAGAEAGLSSNLQTI